MEKFIFSSLLFLAVCLPSLAQVEIDTKALLGTWTAKKDVATAEVTYKKSGKQDYRIEFSAAQLQGSIVMKAHGTWRAEGNSLVQTLDPKTVSVKYSGSNSAIGQQIENMIRANSDKMISQFGGSEGEFVLSDVVVADDLLIFTSQMPSMDGTTKDERVVMRRVK